MNPGNYSLQAEYKWLAGNRQTEQSVSRGWDAGEEVGTDGELIKWEQVCGGV